MNDEINATTGAIELANEVGLELSEVSGTGADGKVYKSDVEDHLAKGVGPSPHPRENSGRAELKTVVRTFSRTGGYLANANAFPGAQIDAYVASFLDEGYKLVNTHYLGENPEGFIMMYVLVRQ